MSLVLRPGTLDDAYLCFEIFATSVVDLFRRLGAEDMLPPEGPDALTKRWEKRRSLVEHIIRTAEHFWIAEVDGQAVGFARTTLRDGVRELTEFFVLPGNQSAGVGRELLARSFPGEGADHRIIIATLDNRALARYMKAGVYPRFPIAFFYRDPEAVALDPGLHTEPLTASAEHLEILNQIDLDVLGFRRETDHRWLNQQRQGYLYWRGDQLVGYGYVGTSCGPFALMNADNFPAVLAHAEHTTAQLEAEFGVEAPLINQAAVDYLLSRGCRMEPFFEFFMSDEPLGHYERYIATDPPFFV